MKTSIYLTAFLCAAFALNAQEDTLSLKDLEVPNAPGFILLDKAPSTIERPKSTKAFVLSVLNAFDSGNGIPKNYAVEFTPFWFFRHPRMTAYKYAGLNADKDRQRVFSQLQRLSVSAAFVSGNDTATAQAVNNLALGLRANLLTWRSRSDIEDLKAAHQKVVSYLRSLDQRLTAAGIVYDPADPASYNKKVSDFLAAEEKARANDKSELAAILKRRAVFAIDGAVGYNHFFLNNQFADSHFGRFGAWLTLNYSQVLNKADKDRNYLNLYALGRYIGDGTTFLRGEYKVQNFLDLGGKCELEFKKLAVSYEYIFRSNENGDTFRSSGMIKYKISDKLLLTGAFGKNFGDANNLISLLGIHWGISSGNEKTVEK